VRCHFTCVRILFEHQRADWNGDFQIVPGGPRFVGPLSVRATPRLKLGVEAEIDQRVLRGSRDDIDGTAGAAIAAVRPAARDELLATETETPIPAVAGSDVDVHLVDEHR
jgi:hypothetical protein